MKTQFSNPLSLMKVAVTHTNNPLDRDLLVKDGWRITVSQKGIEFFLDDSSAKQFDWYQVLRATPHPLIEPSPFQDPACPQCRSCGSYYADQECCDFCAQLSVSDPRHVYDEFRYALQFPDRYFRDAFVKSTNEQVSAFEEWANGQVP